MADYDDDKSIADTEAIWRRIHPTQYVWDENEQRDRPSSGAFEDSTDDGTPMSAARAKLAGHPDAYCAKVTGTWYVTSFPAALPRNYGQDVASEPRVAGEPEHLYIVGRKGKGVRNALAKQSRWVTAPPTKRPA